MFCPYANSEQILDYAERYPKHWALMKKSFGKYLENKKERDFETVDEYFDWWLSNDSIKDYKEKQRQLKLF